MKVRIQTAAAVFILSMAVLMAGCGGGSAGDGDRVVTLGQIPQFTSTTLANAVAKAVLEELGYTVRYEEAEIGIIYQGLAQGDIDVYADQWMPGQQEYWDAWGDRLQRLGVLYDGASLGWVVPEYLTEVQSIEDLAAHVDLFDSDGNGLGEVLSYGAGSSASIGSQAAIEAYGLPFEVIDSSTVALLAEMQARLDRQEPFLGMGWRPHWMFNEWPIRYLEDPKGVWQPSTVYIVAREGFSAENPELAELFGLLRIPLEEFDAMTYAYNVEERDPDEIAREWVEEHRDRVDGWLEQVRGS